jgi:hypothetical protein
VVATLPELLKFTQLASAPFHDYVQRKIEEALKPLIDSDDLRLDFTAAPLPGKAYQLDFESRPMWTAQNRTGCMYHPRLLGAEAVGTPSVPGKVYLDAIIQRNYCRDIYRCDTCVKVYPRSPDELGRAIVWVALHEIGHAFGLINKTSYTGANEGGHTGDSRNPMLSETLHPDYRWLYEDWQRTTKYTIVKGDTLSKIAPRVGLFEPHPRGGGLALYEFKGKDQTRNRDLLRSKDPDIIEPGEQIWIPDVLSKLEFIRKITLEEKSFTKAQFDTMRAWIRKGPSRDDQ